MTFRVSGDAGDIVFSLAIAHGLPGKHSYYLVDRPGITSPITPRFKLIAPLLEAQKYIKSVRLTEDDVDCDFVNFRHFHRASLTLLHSHLAEFQIETGMVLPVDGSIPWLTAEPSTKSEGRIIIAKSPRYPNLDFPWTKIVHHYGKRLLFVGLPEEHVSFCQSHGWVEHSKTKNLLEVAQLIAGSLLMIGNQSSPMAIAMGLGHDLIQCVFIDQPDCIYRRDNAQYVGDGSCILPDIGGSGELKIAAPEPDITHYNQSVVPPGGWQYYDLPPSYHFSGQKGLVAQLEKCDTAQAEEKLMRANVNRVPEFFSDRGNSPMEKFNTAYNKAFQPQTVK